MSSQYIYYFFSLLPSFFVSSILSLQTRLREREELGVQSLQTSKKTTFRPKDSHSIFSFPFFVSRFQSSRLAPTPWVVMFSATFIFSSLVFFLLDVYVACEDWLFVILSAQILVRVIVFARGFYCSHVNASAGRFLMLLCFTFFTSILFMCYSFELGFFFLHLDLESYWWISLTVRKKLK